MGSGKKCIYIYIKLGEGKFLLFKSKYLSRDPLQRKTKEFGVRDDVTSQTQLSLSLPLDRYKHSIHTHIKRKTDDGVANAVRG